jgi:hypothetical protein
MRTASITNIQGFITYVQNNSAWQAATIRSVIHALGYNARGGVESLKDLSGQLVNCAQHGAAGGFPGFIYHSETIAFFRTNRRDIVNNIEQTAAEMGEDVIKLVQSFGEFRNTTPPASGEVGRALWDSARLHNELTDLYKVFAWYALEEVANIWYRYLEENPGYYAELSA